MTLAMHRYQSLRLALVLQLLALSACSSEDSPHLAVRPEEAFDDPRLVRLAYAAEKGDLGAIDRLVREGIDVKATGRKGAAPLWYALAALQKEAFASLLKYGADPNTSRDTGEPLIGYCVMAKDPDFLKMALAHGGNPNAVNPVLRQPIIFYAISEDTTHLELLMAAGADINAQRGDGATLLIEASSALQMSVVLYLLNHGTDPWIRDKVGMDLAAGLFSRYWSKAGDANKARNEVIKVLQAKGIEFDWEVIAKADIRNLGEATGKEPPMWLKSNGKEPNPEWVKANPERAEEWYRTVLNRPVPKK
jgi:ankyrin repeat protein